MGSVVTNPFQAFTDGFSGFLPNGVRYLGGGSFLLGRDWTGGPSEEIRVEDLLDGSSFGAAHFAPPQDRTRKKKKRRTTSPHVGPNTRVVPASPQNHIMVSITLDQFKDLVQKTLNYGDCKDFVATLINKAAELSEGKNDAINTDVMRLFETINSQTKGGGFRLNASFKDIPSYLPPVAGGSGLAWGNVRYGNGVAMVFQKGYYPDRPQGQVERILASYGLTGVHEIIHLAGSRTTYSEGLLGRAAKASDPKSTSFDNALITHCLPPNLR